MNTHSTDQAFPGTSDTRTAEEVEQHIREANLPASIRLPLDSLREQAGAWEAVFEVLNEVSPGWTFTKATAQESAVATIRSLAAISKHEADKVAQERAEPVGEVLHDDKLGCKAGRLFVGLPIGTLLYTRPYVQSELATSDPEGHRQAIADHEADSAQPSPESKPEQAEAPSDKQIAMAMLAVDDPLAWGKLGAEDGKAMIKQFVAALFTTLPPASAAGERGESLALTAALGYVERHTPHLVYSEIRAALATKPQAEQEAAAKGGKLPGFVKPDTDRQVFFYEQDFYVLSNFSAFTLYWDHLRFDTSEAAYHYEKFPNSPSIRAAIKNAPSAHEAYKVAERHKEFRRSDWDAVKVGVMRDLLRAKAEQHEYVRRKLLGTGDRELIEDSWRDSYWGWGPNRDGQNELGKLWMEVRSELRAASNSGGVA
jgi:ribA/ribD-fused uncharacterized protein